MICLPGVTRLRKVAAGSRPDSRGGRPRAAVEESPGSTGQGAR